MKHYYWVNLGLFATWLLASCSSSRQVGKMPEAQVSGENIRNNAPQTKETNSPNELSLVGIQSKFLVKDSTTLRIYLYVDALKNKQPIPLEDFIRLYNLNYVIYSDYGSRDRLGYGNIPLSASNISNFNDQLVIQFDVKKPSRPQGILLSEISEAGTLRKMLNDLPLRLENIRFSDQYAVFQGANEFPLFRHYINAGTQVKIQNLQRTSAPLHVAYYNHDFDPAASPMSTAPRSNAKPFEVDSTFALQSEEVLTFDKEGLYYVRSDTSQTEGIGFIVTNERYPKMTYPQQLTKPLLYMSTNKEITELQNSEDFKKSLDTYWLNLMNGNAEQASQVIKYFYQRVEDANRLFTTYKEGWKTDKGMIYIVLGAPDKVQRSKDKEVWVYDQKANANNINFTFNRRSNQFVDDHYELVRYVEYQPIWYPVVEAWRNGAIR
jgi:GWxTD domain-containing protein